jgi:N-hydroxyarylamine O-acetyltransferase
MKKEDAAAYLARIGHAGSRAPTLETLRALHRAHLHAVPFENLDIHLGRPIRLDPAAFFRKIVGERRGGFCYELNGLFAELLAHLGFPVSLLSAQVAREGGGFGPDGDHLTLAVSAGGRWLVDVGFGRSFHEPLSLDAPLEHEAEGVFYRAAEGDHTWRVESWHPGTAARPAYAFTLHPRPLAAFEEMCEHHQTAPTSHFTQGIVCTLPTARGRVRLSGATLRGATLSEATGDERRETVLEDERAVTAALEQHFGIRLPGAR